MLIAAFLALQAVPIETKICPDGSVLRATEACVVWSDHRLPVFRIFFDSGSSEIRREWQEQIDEAAKRYRGAPRFRIDAYSDTAGSEAGNRRMAAQRGKAVADALKARGIAGDRLSIRVLGETEPLVRTADGVREIQNRRVEIMVFP